MPAPFKKIFITGAGGMLGSDLVTALKSSFELAGAGVTPAPHLSIPYQQIDLSDSKATSDCIGAFRPQIIFHCAAFTDVDAYEKRSEELLKQNALLVESVVRAANQSGAMIIFFSTDYVFDGKKKGEYREDDPVCPVSIYGKSKADAESYIRQNADHYAIFRISWLYGIHGKSFPRTIWNNTTTQSHFKVVSDQIGRPTFTEDIATAFKQLLTKTPDPCSQIDKETFNLSNTGKTSWAHLAEFVIQRSQNPQAFVEKISSGELNRPARRPENSVLSLEKTEKVLGLRLRSWEAAVEEFLRKIEKE